MDEALDLPSPCMVILAGSGASGKSTWAAGHFPPDCVVSSDRLRAIARRGVRALWDDTPPKAISALLRDRALGMTQMTAALQRYWKQVVPPVWPGSVWKTRNRPR